MWFAFALLSAVFAAFTSILAKIGISGVSSNLATAIRTIVVVLMAWLMVFITGEGGGISTIPPPFFCSYGPNFQREGKSAISALFQ